MANRTREEGTNHGDRDPKIDIATLEGALAGTATTLLLFSRRRCAITRPLVGGLSACGQLTLHELRHGLVAGNDRKARGDGLGAVSSAS
jgi:hypothetical protein